MVIILSPRKSKIEKEIIEILKNYGANYISDKVINETNNGFLIVSAYKKTEIKTATGIVLFTEKTLRFKEQKFPIGIVGICEENNKYGLETFKRNKNAVITCGNNNKNTLTLSSNRNNTILATLQRSFYDNKRNIVEPCELRINLRKHYSPFSVMSAAIILLYHGITPTEF